MLRKLRSLAVLGLAVLLLCVNVLAIDNTTPSSVSEDHNISCKFDCDHVLAGNTSVVNNIPMVSSEELISQIAEEHMLSDEDLKTLEDIVYAESVVTSYSIITEHDDCKFQCIHENIAASSDTNNVPRIAFDEMASLINTEIQPYAKCTHVMGPPTCGVHVSKGNCVVICYGNTKCILCNYSVQQIYEHEEHTWTNGGVCGKKCTSCGRIVYNPGHGPGSGHSWCTND